MVTSCRSVLVYDIDALIKGFTADDDVSAMGKWISSKKMRILQNQDPEMDHDDQFWTNIAMNKFSLTRYTEYSHNPNPQIRVQKLDFWCCDETPED